MKEEEKVTTLLFNTIIPKHVSDQFLSELRYRCFLFRLNITVVFLTVAGEILREIKTSIALL